MNLIGDTRDVTPRDFRDVCRCEFREAAEQAWERLPEAAPREKSKGEPVPALYQQTLEAWLSRPPLGYIEYKEAFAPRGSTAPGCAASPSSPSSTGTSSCTPASRRLRPSENRRSERPDVATRSGNSISSSHRLVDLRTRDSPISPAGNPAGRLERDRGRAMRRSWRPRSTAQEPDRYEAQHSPADGGAGDR